MILVISRDRYVETATEAGKSGYTRKNLRAERLAEALWEAYKEWIP